MRVLRRPLVWVAVFCVFAGGAGVAYATQVATADATSVINACFKQNGTIRLVAAVSECDHNDTPISWNVQGPKGDVGPAGPQGPTGPTGPAGADGEEGEDGADGAPGTAGADGKDGAPGATGPTGPSGPTGPAGADGAPGTDGAPGANGVDGADGADGADGEDGADGVSVVSTSLPAGDANCPHGGSKLVAATGTTYACNGADGSGAAFNGSYTSPNGKYKLRVTNNGILLSGPGGSFSIERTIVRLSDGTPWAASPWSGQP
jgi:hypothetical protein